MPGFGDLVQKAFYLGVGVASYAGEKAGGAFGELRSQAQKLADEMVARGEMTTEEAKRLVDEMVSRAQQQANAAPPKSSEPERPAEPRRIEILSDDEPVSSQSDPTDDLRQQVVKLQEELRRLQNPQLDSHTLMEGWQQDWWKMLETVAEEIERFVIGVVEDLEAAANALIDFTEEVAEQVEHSLTPEFDDADDRLDEWIDPLLDFINSIEATMGEVAAPVTHTVEPMLNQHPACVGCRHYHGQSYGGTVLVCGMHPYGWEDEKCPDWESTWPHLEN